MSFLAKMKKYAFDTCKWTFDDTAIDQKVIQKKEAGSAYVSPTMKQVFVYASQLTITGDQLMTSPKFRPVVVEWIMEVCTEYKLSSQTLWLTVTLFDRYLRQTQLALCRNDVQLIMIGSLFIMAKFEEVYALKASTCVALSCDTYTCKQLRIKERISSNGKLELISFTPLDAWYLMMHTLSGMHTDQPVQTFVKDQHEISERLLECSLLDPMFVYFSSSTKAISAIVQAFRQFSKKRTVYRMCATSFYCFGLCWKNIGLNQCGTMHCALNKSKNVLLYLNHTIQSVKNMYAKLPVDSHG